MTSKQGERPRVQIIACDAGGTMTDAIIVDEAGRFSIGKASTTPEDQSIGYIESLADGFDNWGIDFASEAEALLGDVDAVVYAGTAMLNALITGTGSKVGVIVRRGDEDVFIHQRVSQSWLGLSYADTLHHAAHHYPPPLVPRRLVHGVSGRIDCQGKEVIPLVEQEIRQAVGALLDEGVESIAVCLLFSYINPGHELMLADIARDVMRVKGREIPVHLSCKLAPISREQGRLNTVWLHAAAVDTGRKQYELIERALHQRGYRNPLQVVLSHGGIANIRYSRLHESAFSGPIGGLLGARFMAREMGIDNWICADMGGTSFDVGLIMGQEPLIEREVTITRRIFNMPTLMMETITAGMGLYVSVDPITQRITLGPESAGAHPGPVSYDKGNETPTIMDCALVTGLINPHNYLGGKVKLNMDKALRMLDEKCAKPLNVDPYYIAEGVLRLIASQMKEQLRTTLSIRGLSPVDYNVLAYGGAGPLLLALYTEGLPFKGVATVPWAAGFSAFGAATVDLMHRYEKSAGIVIPHGIDDSWKSKMGEAINTIWDELETQAREDFLDEGLSVAAVAFKPIAFVRYGGQMEDLEVRSPIRRISSARELDSLIDVFERQYERAYAGVAKHEQAGFEIFDLGIEASLPKPKPKLVRRPLGPREPVGQAVKGERRIYFDGHWQNATIYDMDALSPGNEVGGPAILEAATTTYFLPLGRSVHLDDLSVIWLE
ncbi:MAG: hydantoinase/oxoprolinase family protein [Pseudomonadales bacterium]|nr:hydantoinase/oxoprolinase family protein [Gammaproteobacteria bacterium]MBP6051093.1 hydantoinase/oxoprolinase family protein [Pseudomonadales bacterium]